MSVAEYLTGSEGGNGRQLPERRIRDSSAADSIAMVLIQEDLLASQNRAQLDALVDGRPPYNQEDLDDSGQSDRINVNTKDATSLCSQAVQSYYDLTSSPETLISLNTKFGDDVQRPEWCDAIAEEITKGLRRWGLWTLRTSNLHVQYVRHGISVGFFENEVDWRFRTAGLNDFKIRRNTPASEEEVDVALVSTPYTVTDLYNLACKNPEAARDNGWDVRQARRICLDNVNTVMTSNNQPAYQNWEMLERQIKENDLYYGSGDYHIWLNHLWVKEFDGSITHIITPRDTSISNQDGDAAFLYENRSQFENCYQAFSIFANGIGGGTYHTIRGLLWDIFDQEQAYNRLWNTAMDGAMGNSVTMLQPKTGANVDLTRAALSFNGPFAIIPGGYDVVNRTIPDYTKAVIPVLSELKSQIRNNSQQYSHAPSQDAAQHVSAKNYATYLQQMAALSDSALDLWYAPWGRLLAEVVRRMTSREYGEGDPGYAEVLEIKKRLKERGVPLEAWYEVFDVQPVRAVGAGSKQMRLQAYDAAIASGSAETDQAGRYNLIRDRNALVLGRDVINRYFPAPSTEMRFNQDSKNAEFENALAQQFIPSTVSASDNNTIHCASHSGLINAVMQPVAQGGSQALDDLVHAFKILNVLVPHFAQHVQNLTKDASRQAETKHYQQFAQQATAELQRIKNTIQRQMQAQQEAQQAEQQRQQEAFQAHYQQLQEQAAAAQQGGDPKVQAKIQQDLIAHHVKMGIVQAQAQQKLESQRALAQQQLDLQRATLAQQLAFKDSDNAMTLLHQGKANPYANPITGQ